MTPLEVQAKYSANLKAKTKPPFGSVFSITKDSEKPLTGFALIEILLVIFIFIILAFSLAPIGLNFYINQQLEANTQEVIFTLRQAQTKSMSVEMDSAFGVYFEGNDYILFKGDSYSERDSGYDQIFSLPRIINKSGISEVVFSKFKGEPKNLTYSTNCEGGCIPCSEFNNPRQCQKQAGCSWIGPPIRMCIGNCTPCNQLENQQSCESQLNCTWALNTQEGNIILSVNNKINIININEIGRINLQ